MNVPPSGRSGRWAKKANTIIAVERANITDGVSLATELASALTTGVPTQFDATAGTHPTAAEEFVTMREPVRG